MSAESHKKAPAAPPPATALLPPTGTVEQTTPKLHPLIESCPPDFLVSTIKTLCVENPSFSTVLLVQLLAYPAPSVPKPPAVSGGVKRKEFDESDESEDSEIDRKVLKSYKKGKSKHTTDTHAVCLNCNDLFKRSKNRDGDCEYHDGELEVDSDEDTWPDHDEDCHGIIDSDELRCEYPENYIWSCCNEPGDMRGCAGGKHRASGSTEEYARLRAIGFEY